MEQLIAFERINQHLAPHNIALIRCIMISFINIKNWILMDQKQHRKRPIHIKYANDMQMIFKYMMFGHVFVINIINLSSKTT
eukprot:UN13787